MMLLLVIKFCVSIEDQGHHQQNQEEAYNKLKEVLPEAQQTVIKNYINSIIRKKKKQLSITN